MHLIFSMGYSHWSQQIECNLLLCDRVMLYYMIGLMVGAYACIYTIFLCTYRCLHVHIYIVYMSMLRLCAHTYLPPIIFLILLP